MSGTIQAAHNNDSIIIEFRVPTKIVRYNSLFMKVSSCWLSQFLTAPSLISVTEREVRKGIIDAKDTKDHCLAYIREITGTILALGPLIQTHHDNLTD